MDTQVKIFDNPEFGNVRVIMRNGEPWFVAKDVARALGYTDTDQAIRRHCEKVNDLNPVVSTGIPSPKIIPEEDVYALIFGSHLESAKKFRRWLCDDVLPSIRKTGGYGVETVTLEARIKAAAAVLAPAGIEGNQLTLALDRLHRRELGYSALEATGIELVAPTQEQLLTPTQIGKLLTPPLSARKVNIILELHDYQTNINGLWTPTEKGLEAGAVLMDTGKLHSGGTPIRQLKWPESILKVLKAEVA